jgi:outer membrane biogenesis lipoprotein LolB
MEESESVVIQSIGFLVVTDSYLLHFSSLLLRACGLSELRQNDQQATEKWQTIKLKVS